MVSNKFNLSKILHSFKNDNNKPENGGTSDASSAGDLERFERERKLKGWQSFLFIIIAILMAWFHIYYMTYGYTSTISLRSGHLMFAMLGAFLFYPFSQKNSRKDRASWIDLFLCILCLITGFYIILTYESLVWRLGDLYTRDIVLGTILVVLTLEMTRRVMGWALPMVALSAIVYIFLGPWIPGLMGHSGIDFTRLIGQLYCTLEGIYGVAIGAMVSFIYLFILYGAFLIKTGAAKFFIELAFLITGKSVGGPAKASVVASGTLAMISGSAQANVVTTGTITIPTMKKMGYPAHTAAAVETAASAGGIFTPPIMGAGAFIMADWLGVPYLTIIKAAAIPAALYFFSLLLFVHISALELGVQKEKSDIRSVSFISFLKAGSPFIASICILIFMLVTGYTPQYSVLISMAVLIVISMIWKETRLGFKDFIEALVMGAKNTILASAACACAGIVIGVVGLTGLGLKFSTLVLSLSGGILIWGIVLMLLASLVLGMGLTVTPAYITLAVLGAPAMVELGLSPLAAHMIIFWFSQDSQVTPPVCVTAYTAAAVARSDPFKTGISAWALAKGLYIIPIFMAYTNLLEGSIYQMLIATIICALCLISFNGIMHGYMFRKLNVVERANFGISAILLMIADYRSWLVGALLLLAGIIYQKAIKKSENDYLNSDKPKATALIDPNQGTRD